VHWEAHVFWPTEPEPRILAAPGKQVFAFPCKHAEGEVLEVEVTARELSEGTLAAELARLTAEMEGQSGTVKVYGEYSPMTVYRYAGANERITVDFADRIKAIARPPLPDRIDTVPALRNGVRSDVRITRALQAESGMTLLVPDTFPSLVQQTAALVPGQTIRVRGTVIGQRGTYRCVLVDFFTVPPIREGREESSTWWVSVEWDGLRRPYRYWGYGQHALPALPCRNISPGQARVRLLVSQFREVRVPQRRRAPSRPAPEADAEEAPAEE
jgi:hypothetical protein